MAPLTHPAIIQTLEESVKTKRAAAGRGTAAAGRGTQELLTGVSRSFSEFLAGGTIGSEFYAGLGQAVRYPYRP